MLSREEASRRLQPFRLADYPRGFLAAVARLPRRLAALGRALRLVDEQGKALDYQTRQEALAVAARELETISAPDRRRLFAAVLPKLADHVERGWQLFDRLPYQMGPARRSFRAADDAAAHALQRFWWLHSLVETLGPYDPDLAWCAAWTPHLSGPSSEHSLGQLFAAAIDAGGKEGDEVFEILKQSATNQHETGGMGRHVTRALLVASRPEGWEFVERLLLAAQRQEGLRQVILESIDEAHPEAFKRMLQLILGHNLLRFSATVRAIDVWFGLQWLALTPAVLRKTLEQVVRFFEEEAALDEALRNATGETFFLALWCVAFRDAHSAIPHAVSARTDPDVERRFVAAHFLTQLQLKAAGAELPAFLDDADLRVALRALWGCPATPEQFDAFTRLLGRMPAKDQQLEPLVWPWGGTMAVAHQVADKLVGCLGDRPATDLLPYLPRMSGYGKRNTIDKLCERKRRDGATRDTLLSLLGDRDGWVRSRAREALADCTLTEGEAERLEGLLSRKASDLRRGVLTVLGKQKTPGVLASADRLIGSRKLEPRSAGLELLRQLAESGEAVAECRGRVAEYRKQYASLSDQELSPIEAVENAGRPVPSLDDALGLMDPARRTKPIKPRLRKTAFLTKATLECLKSLDDLIAANRETPVTYQSHQGPQEGLLGSLYGWALSSPDLKLPADKDAERLVLRGLWEGWFAKRPSGLRDKDGCELLRALFWVCWNDENWRNHVEKAGPEWRPLLDHMSNKLKPVTLKYGWSHGLVAKVCEWLVRLHPPEQAAAFFCDTLESLFALVPEEVYSRVIPANTSWQEQRKEWRGYYSPTVGWSQFAANNSRLTLAGWSGKDVVRWWHLLHWRDEPAPGVARHRPPLDVVLRARAEGAATEADIYDQLLGPKQSFDDLKTLTHWQAPAVLRDNPELSGIVERCRERILEVGLGRGENPTAAALPARALQSVRGLPYLAQFVTALGKRPFKYGSGAGRAEVLTHLVSVTYPGPADTPEAFADWARRAKVDPKRLLQLGLLAPQWLPHTEHALGWPGLREGLWWLLAHGCGYADAGALACDDAMSPGFNLKERWEKLLRERTALSANDRQDGLVDVEWFRRVYDALGRKRWEALGEAAKVRWGGSQLRKALFTAETLLGRVPKSELVRRVREKFSREAVRLLGLLPLAKGVTRDADLQGRYRVFMAYRRHARSLSPMGQEGALRDLEIGLGNLARTAGFPDPVRLGWAMEARELADLARGPVAVTSKGVAVTLALNESHQPQLSVRRGEKALKAIPPDVRKAPKVAALVARQGELKRQASRVRQSLEAMMVRGDTFTGAELRQLFSHPLLRPLLERLVILGEGIRGYPIAEGQALEDHAGRREPVKPGEKLRLAHPYDLFAVGDWDKWQRHCFASEKVQPFKQLFRELYVVTGQEQADGAVSSRYSGQQVQPRQAMALWGSRGWNTRDEVAKTFHGEGLVAEVTFRHHGWTPAEVEGWTLEGVQFRKRGEYKPIPLVEVPPRLFSEVMRDGDLVVSVAHAGGVDPDASASTTRMREALVRETCALLNITNYKVVKTHLVIEGKLGTYTLHLGSGVVHRQPGGHVCIVPAHAQHRGRLFLPFADDDPRTAEVLSKLLLLARDHEIQDPTILEQLR
jgi:hypothetical protein